MAFLGNRLEAALALLTRYSVIPLLADIGSDHSLLAIEAVERGIASEAIAADINPFPLETGRKNALSRGANIRFVISDGFASLEGEPLSACAICGMGGELIASIIAESSAAKKLPLVLQPMTKQDRLRKYLWDGGWTITDESFVSEGTKPYALILASYTGEKTGYSYPDLFLGKLRPKTEDFARYAFKLLSSAEKQLKGELAEGKDTDATRALIAECQMHTTSF